MIITCLLYSAWIVEINSSKLQVQQDGYYNGFKMIYKQMARQSMLPSIACFQQGPKLHVSMLHKPNESY